MSETSAELHGPASRPGGVFLVLLLALAACEATPREADSRPAGAGDGRLSLSDSLATWYHLGIGAHHLCSGLWVVGRDYARDPEVVVEQDIARFEPFQWEEDFTYEVDREGRSVTVRDPGVGSRTAKYSGDQGCAILPPGASGVYFEPEEVTPGGLPDPDEVAWPTGDLDRRADLSPEDSASLGAVLDWAFDDEGRAMPQNTRGLVVVHQGKIVAERYAPGWGPYTPQLSWSMGKSVASALTGVLVEQGAFEPRDPAPVPHWQAPRDPRREIRIVDLLRMSSGLDFDNFGLDPDASYIAGNEHFRIYFDAVDVHLHAVNQPLRFEPGTVWRYRNSDPLSLMYLAERKMEERGESFLAFPYRHLFHRLGMRSMVLETDAWGNFIVTGYDFGGSRDWARFGLLHLEDGVWEGERILPEGWVELVSSPAPGDPGRGYGGLFWLNRGGAMERVPEDAYWAAGYMGQRTLIIPSRELVVVRHGPSPGGFGPYFEELVVRILEALGEG